MTKYLMALFCLFAATNAQAQMTDSLGALAIDGMLTGQAMQGVGQMQNALNKVKFQQDLAELNLKIQTTFMHNYDGLEKSALDFGGFQGVDWQVRAVSPQEYYIEFSRIDSAMCEYIRLNNDAKRAEINNGAGCRGNANNIRLYY